MTACAKAVHAVKDRLRNNALDETDTSTDSKDSNTNQEERSAKHLLCHRSESFKNPRKGSSKSIKATTSSNISDDNRHHFHHLRIMTL